MALFPRIPAPRSSSADMLKPPPRPHLPSVPADSDDEMPKVVVPMSVFSSPSRSSESSLQ